jgi:hypothetical protein
MNTAGVWAQQGRISNAARYEGSERMRYRTVGDAPPYLTSTFSHENTTKTYQNDPTMVMTDNNAHKLILDQVRAKSDPYSKHESTIAIQKGVDWTKVIPAEDVDMADIEIPDEPISRPRDNKSLPFVPVGSVEVIKKPQPFIKIESNNEKPKKVETKKQNKPGPIKANMFDVTLNQLTNNDDLSKSRIQDGMLDDILNKNPAEVKRAIESKTKADVRSNMTTGKFGTSFLLNSVNKLAQSQKKIKKN